MRTVEEWLASEETGKPFTHCVRCKLPLLETDCEWLVNKDIVGDECVLEYAVCQKCRDEVTGKLSEESKRSVRSFLEIEIDWEARTVEFMAQHDPLARFERCIACLTPREMMTGYGLSALFDADGKLVTGALPLLICRPCIGRMTAGISIESRKVWTDFLAENFEGPPVDPGFPGMF